MDQTPQLTSNSSIIQTDETVVSCQMSPTIASSSNASYVLTSNNLRPVTNYTLVSSSQVPVTHQYVVQTNSRTTSVPQYVNTGNVSHILPSTSQSSNVTYMLPSGAHIVQMNNLTTTIDGDQRSNAQYILTSNSQKTNSNIISSLGSHPAKTTITENTSSTSGVVSKNIGVTTDASTIFQRSNVNLSKLNSTYSQIKGDETPKISYRPKLNKLGTNFILTPNSDNKNLPISTLRMQIPLIRTNKPMLSSNTLKPNADFNSQQVVRSIIVPSNYQTAINSQNQSTDCKLVLNSLKVPTQVINSQGNQSSTSNIQQLNTHYMQIPKTQKQGQIEKNKTISSVILPSNYQSSMLTTPGRSGDYRLILKPVLRNFSSQNAVPRQPVYSVRPISLPIRSKTVTSKVQNELIATSKITPIPLRNRKNQLIISKESIQICINEIDSKKNKDESNLNITDSAMELIQTEVTYRLFYLLRECKKVLIKSRSNILTEKNVREVCGEYFTTFYGNKLWPLFCLKPNNDDPNCRNNDKIWMRKHNYVNLVGWLKHPKFLNPSYIKKRRRKNIIQSIPLRDLMKISEVVYEEQIPETAKAIENSELPHTITKKFYQSLKDNQTTSSDIIGIQ